MQVECPWCDAPVAVEPDGDGSLRCEPCQLVVELSDASPVERTAGKAA